MKNLALVLATTLILSARAQIPLATNDFQVIERGLNHQVWAKLTPITNSAGNLLRYITNSYTELHTGLNFTNSGGNLTSTVPFITVTRRAPNSQHSSPGPTRNGDTQRLGHNLHSRWLRLLRH